MIKWGTQKTESDEKLQRFGDLSGSISISDKSTSNDIDFAKI
jgi:hypothetical protein